MTGGQITPADRELAARPPGLLEKLLAAIRPEFRADELVFDPADAVFGGELCLVTGCGRTACSKQMCTAHHQRWAAAGRPDVAAFAAATDPRWRKDAPLARCQAPGCRYGITRRRGLCYRHGRAWERAGAPELRGWLAGLPAVVPASPPADCLIGTCQLWAEPGAGLCAAHRSTWSRRGKPPADQFAAGWAAGGPVPAYQTTIRLGELPAQLRLEMQYALQRRHDERAGKAAPLVITSVVRVLAASGTSSLLDRTEQQWREPFGKNRPNAAAVVAWARRQITDLAEGDGWDAEYGRDTWRLHRLGFDGRHTVSFAGIPQPWLKDLAKRWVRWRLSTGLAPSAGGWQPVRALTRLASFLAARGITGMDRIDRALLEEYLAGLRAEMGGSRRRHGEHVSMIGGFLAAVRRHGWDDTLPASAMIFPGDHPRRGEQLPRALAGHVMAQVEQPAALQRWNDPAGALVTVILIRCGLRVTDALRLSCDCVVTDPSGAPYLRYYNHKMKREALVPVDDELRSLIGAQQRRIRDRWPAAPVLFPRLTKNPDGNAPVSSSAYRQALYRWLAGCDIRDENGQPVHLTPHQWRHTLGTTLINHDVPQHIVQKILDHDSPLMTAHYARLSDKTVRAHWEKARKVSATGQPVTISPDGPLGDAAWASHHLSRATQALPNGYCQLPLIKTCPHANSCLTCPMFVTTAEFLPRHHAQRQATLQLITTAEAAGHTRVAEMNKQVAANLDNIITALEASTGDTQEATASA